MSKQTVIKWLPLPHTITGLHYCQVTNRKLRFPSQFVANPIWVSARCVWEIVKLKWELSSSVAAYIYRTVWNLTPVSIALSVYERNWEATVYCSADGNRGEWSCTLTCYCLNKELLSGGRLRFTVKLWRSLFLVVAVAALIKNGILKMLYLNILIFDRCATQMYWIGPSLGLA